MNWGGAEGGAWVCEPWLLWGGYRSLRVCYGSFIRLGIRAGWKLLAMIAEPANKELESV